MASSIDKRPNFRISDVEELMRETGMDNSDTGIGIVNYFRRRQADFHRGRLFDSSDNQINFRLDNLQPVQLPLPPPPAAAAASVDDAGNGANVAEEAQVGTVLVRPLSELTVAENRVPSFVSPGRVAPNSPSRYPPRPLTSTVSSPPGRSTVHVSPIVSMVSRKSSAQNNLQREMILQKHKRENQMKMEMLRNSAAQLASSTPIAGDHTERRSGNLLDMRETISPIHEDAVQGTPKRVPGTVNGEHRDHQVPPRPSTTHARAIRTPIPATQDAPDGMDRNVRENTPSPPLNANCMVVVPETPSPVRKSPRIPNTPLSGLSLTKRTSHLSVPAAMTHLGKGKSIHGIDIRSPACSTPSRSILKKRESRFASSRHRVSFSEQLFAVRERTPSLSDSHMTSDEDEAQDSDNGPAKPVEERAGNEEENAHHSRRLFGARRSNAVEEWDKRTLHDTPKRHNDRTNGDMVNMIMDDWNEPMSDVMEVDEPQENREPPEAARTINNSVAITNIDTPRTVMMDIFDPPSAFCDADDDAEKDEEKNELNVEEPAAEVPALKRPEQSRKRKAKEGGSGGDDGGDDSDRDSRNSIDENNDQAPTVSPQNIAKLSFNVTISNVLHTERIVSVDSPNDHVPQEMIQAVDMIHSRVNSELMDPGGAGEHANERRTTLHIPSKRRTTIAKVNPDAELYIKAIENVCSQNKSTSTRRKDRRKLFAREMSEVQKETEDFDEPQPLPPTQEAADTAELDKQEENRQRYQLKSLVVPVNRLSINTINRAINAGGSDAEETGISAQPKQAAIESPIQEKQNEEQNEKGDRPKKITSDDDVGTKQDRPMKAKGKPRKEKSNRKQSDDVVGMEQARPRKGKSNREQCDDHPRKEKSNREQRDDVMEREQDRPRNGKTNREQSDDGVDMAQDRPRKEKSNREQSDDEMDTEQDRPMQGKTNSEKRDDVVDMEKARPRKGKSNREQRDDHPRKEKSNREQRDDVMEREQDRPRKGTTNREQSDDDVDMAQARPRKGKSNREHNDDDVDAEQDRPRKKGKTNREQRDDVMDKEQDPRKETSKPKPPKTTAKNKKQPRQSDVMLEKYLKNVSNEIRHQIESEGPRRSHRSRRLAAEVLRNNPNTLQTDAPKYVMPTLNDVLKYYHLSVKPNTNGGKAKSKSKPCFTTVANQETETIEKPKENVPPTAVPEGNGEIKRPKGRPKKNAQVQTGTFDADGFRVPPPMDGAISGPNVERSEMCDSSSPSLPQGVSVDSGLSSAVMTSYDATAAASAGKKRAKPSSKKQTAVAQPEPSCSYDSSTVTTPAPSDVLAEKRKTLDWMMMLMEKQQNYSPALPMVEPQGFTHLSVEHLMFEEKDGIEYSFYVYSNGDNFGFLRFPPKTEKRSTRTKRCALKFLILNGTVDFTINEVHVTAVGGDFLMIPTCSTYRIVNGPATTLMFMIKSIASPPLGETTGGGK